MDTYFFVKRDYIVENKIDNESLLLLVLLSWDVSNSELDYIYINIPCMVNYVSNKSNRDFMLRKMNQSLRKLHQLNIIKIAEEYGNGSYKILVSSMKVTSPDDYYVKVCISNIVKISQNLKGCNIYKLVKLYLIILAYSDFSSRLPKRYKNKVYHLGVKYLIDKSGLSKKTYQKYMKTLLDNEVLYLRQGKMSGSYYRTNFISRYEDREICDKFYA